MRRALTAGQSRLLPGPTPNSGRPGSCPRASGRGDLQPRFPLSLRTRGQITERERRSRHNFSPARQPLAGPGLVPAPHTARTLRGAWAGRRQGQSPTCPATQGSWPQTPPPGPPPPLRATPPDGPAPPPRPASARCSGDSGCARSGAHGFPR